MPTRESVWSSWNSISDGSQTCVTYWLNRLQNLNTSKNYYLTLNPIININDSLIIKKKFSNYNINIITSDKLDMKQLSKIKVISYEYLSIIYNYFKGNI